MIASSTTSREAISLTNLRRRGRQQRHQKLEQQGPGPQSRSRSTSSLDLHSSKSRDASTGSSPLLQLPPEVILHHLLPALNYPSLLALRLTHPHFYHSPLFYPARTPAVTLRVAWLIDVGTATAAGRRLLHLQPLVPPPAFPFSFAAIEKVGARMGAYLPGGIRRLLRNRSVPPAAGEASNKAAGARSMADEPRKQRPATSTLDVGSDERFLANPAVQALLRAERALVHTDCGRMADAQWCRLGGEGTTCCMCPAAEERRAVTGTWTLAGAFGWCRWKMGASARCRGGGGWMMVVSTMIMVLAMVLVLVSSRR